MLITTLSIFRKVIEKFNETLKKKNIYFLDLVYNPTRFQHGMFSGPDKDELLIVRAQAGGCSIGFQESTFKPFIIIKFLETCSVDVNKVITDINLT